MKMKNSFPSFISLSLSVRCQAKCIYCPANRGEGVEPSFMPFELAKKIIDEAYQEGFTGRIRFSENGEALLNKDFLKIFKYCRQKFPNNKWS